jgi:hypothetical protein
VTYTQRGCFTRPPHCEPCLGLSERAYQLFLSLRDSRSRRYQQSWTSIEPKTLEFLSEHRISPERVPISGRFWTLNQQEFLRNFEPSETASTIKNKLIFAISTHLFAFPTAFPAISWQSKSAVEVWVAGAAVWLTAATRDRCNAPPVMATSMMAASTVETQSRMGGGDGERMPVV